MTPDQKDNQEQYVFEFYDDDYISLSKPKKAVKESEYNKVNFEANLNEEQLEVINNLKGPMLVIAGAGSGKTRTIVYAVAKLLLSGVYPNEIMLVTFTNKAANEMIGRVKYLLGKRPKGIWAGTFHSMANRFLRIYSRTLGFKPNYTIMDEADSKSLMKASIEAANVKEIEEKFPSPAQTKSILSYSINCNLSIKDVVQWKNPLFDNENILNKLSEVYDIYAKKKESGSLVDFDDLLVFWNRLLDERNVAQMLAERIKYVLVDEYQDTNYIQDEIIQKIVNNNKEQNIMVVGDDAQSIYSFRGADFHNILQFEKRYPNCKKYSITYNYRSIPQILKLANDSIRHNKNQFKKEMKPTRKPGSIPFRVELDDDDSQARFIANQVLQLKSEGYKYSEIAVLYRAAYHSLKIEMDLKNKAIPYEVRAGLSFFERAHVKDILAHLRVIENPFDETSWIRIFGIIEGLGGSSGAKIFTVISQSEDPIKELFNPDLVSVNLKGLRIPKKGLSNLIEHVKKFSEISREEEPSSVISQLNELITIYIQTKYEDWDSRLDDLEQLAIYAQNFPSIQKFLENLSLNQSTIESKRVKGNSKDKDVMVLSTIHRAKGLEWKVIFIPMLCEHIFPNPKSYDDTESYEEERRIFYVAMTRAKDQLYLLYPTRVRVYGDYQYVEPSPFLSELNSKLFKRSTVNYYSSY